MVDQKVTDAVQTLMNALNDLSVNNRRKVADEIAAVVCREHRTIQQAFWSALMLAQIKYAECGVDGRNECAVKLARGVKVIAQALNYDAGLPYV